LRKHAPARGAEKALGSSSAISGGPSQVPTSEGLCEANVYLASVLLNLSLLWTEFGFFHGCDYKTVVEAMAI